MVTFRMAAEIVLRARVRGGAIVLDAPVELPEGARVVVFIADTSEGAVGDEGDFELTAEQAAELDAAGAEADRGETVTWTELKAHLQIGR